MLADESESIVLAFVAFDVVKDSRISPVMPAILVSTIRLVIAPDHGVGHWFSIGLIDPNSFLFDVVDSDPKSSIVAIFISLNKFGVFLDRARLYEFSAVVLTNTNQILSRS